MEVRRSKYTELLDLVCDRYIQILHVLKLKQFIVSINWYWTVKVKFLPLQVCLSARILASCRSRRYRLIRRYHKFRGLCLGLCLVGKNLSNDQIKIQGHFQMHFHPPAGQEF